MSEDVPFTEEELHDLYMWAQKKNIARDFSDGCCVAEILHHYFPKLVELHNYVPAMGRARKIANWETLNARVLSKLYFSVPRDEIEDLTAAVPGAIERFLRALRIKISQIKAHQEALQKMPEHLHPDLHPEPSPRHAPKTAPEKPRASSRSSATTTQHRDPVSVTTDSSAAAIGELLLDERGRTIVELKETVSILTEKIMKLEELVRIKDEKLSQYRSRFGKV
eukprot:gene7220-5073_t